MSERKVQDTLPSSKREDEAPEQPQTEERWKSGVAKVPLNLSEIPTASFKMGQTVRASKTDSVTKRTGTTTCIVRDVKYDGAKREHTYQLKEKSTGEAYESGVYVAESRLR